MYVPLAAEAAARSVKTVDSIVVEGVDAYMFSICVFVQPDSLSCRDNVENFKERRTFAI